jgi:hypothetical protein
MTSRKRKSPDEEFKGFDARNPLTTHTGDLFPLRDSFRPYKHYAAFDTLDFAPDPFQWSQENLGSPLFNNEGFGQLSSPSFSFHESHSHQNGISMYNSVQDEAGPLNQFASGTSAPNTEDIEPFTSTSVS